MPHYYFLVVVAVVLQIFRHYEQKKLIDHFNKSTITLMRFLLPLPFAVVYLTIFHHLLDLKFLLLSATISLLQISGGIYILKSFSKQNFANSMALAHTELLFAVLLGISFFQQSISWLMFFTIIVIVVAIFLIGNFKISKNQKIINKSSIFALSSAFIFAINAFLLKETSSYFIKINTDINHTISTLTLFFALHLFHNIFLITYKITQKNLFIEIKKIFQYESGFSFIKIGSISSLTTALWYYIYTVGDIMMVKAISQLEVVLAIVVSHHLLKEKFRYKEIIGILLLLISLLYLIYLKN
jgi:drug/metabolite transporter (DMT)-like permease